MLENHFILWNYTYSNVYSEEVIQTVLSEGIASIKISGNLISNLFSVDNTLLIIENLEDLQRLTK